MTLHFFCPKCHNYFVITSYWKWIWQSPFHFFGKRKTKCSHCNRSSWNRWFMIER